MTTSESTVRLGPSHHAARAAVQNFITELQESVDGDGIRLPSPPGIILKIRQALADENADAASVTAVIGSDPAVAARLLRVSNSALFRRTPEPVSDLQTAVVRLGLKTVRNVALSIAAQQVFVGHSMSRIHPLVSQTWRHSIHVATLAYLLAKQLKKITPDEAFLAGLLHETGKLYILLRAHDHPALFENDAFLEMVDHWQAGLGAEIMRLWEFPEPLIAAVEGHRECALRCSSPASLTEIVAIANHLAESFDYGSSGAVEIESVPDFGELKLDRDKFEWILAVAETDTRQLEGALGG